MQWKTNETADNKGSSANLVNYQNKEKGLDEEQQFYNGQESGVKKAEVIKEIDRYGRGQIKKDQKKFHHMTYNLSEKESRHLVKQVTGKDATSWKDLNNAEKKEVNQAFSSLVVELQDQQAKNYKRDKIKGHEDLKWYAKNHTERKWKGFDEEVKQGKAKSGEYKKGFNLHAHITQSVKAMDKKTKLSPHSNHRKATNKGVKQGFDRKEFINRQEQTFDKMFDYKRGLDEKFEYKNAVKKNDLEQIEKLQKSKIMDKEQSQKQQPQSRIQSEEIGKAKAEMTDAQKRFLQKEKELEHKREQEQNQRKGMRR